MASWFNLVKLDRVEMVPRSSTLDLLQAIGYVESTYDPHSDERGVLLHDSARTFPGYNFYNSFKGNMARLIGMDGGVLHEWSYKFDRGHWHHAELLNDGSVLVVVRDRALIKIDKESALLWTHLTRAHHDLWVDNRDQIHILTREAKLIPEIHPEVPILFDKIETLTPSGQLLRSLSVLELVQRSEFAYLLPSVAHLEFKDTEIDLLHANHIEVFDGSQVSISPLFAEGNMLISMKNLNAIAIIDGEALEIVWLWGPTNVALQHHPRLLEGGRILLFDNGTETSRVIEMDPLTGRIEWSYEDGASFFSAWGGANQRLPNGNTLITQTNGGYAFEITPSMDVVWKFANPEVEDDLRTNIWRMTRHIPTELQFID